MCTRIRGHRHCAVGDQSRLIWSVSGRDDAALPARHTTAPKAQSVADIGTYVPGSNGPGSEKPSIAWTFAKFSAMLSGLRSGS
jgi:hypothetical protein